MYEGPVQDLIDELGRLPSIGPKSAQRLAFFLLSSEKTDVLRLADTLVRVKETIGFCSRCGNIAEGDLCRICRNERRDPSVICVVEEPRDVVAVERTQEFRGLYHVLGGALSPLDGITPDRLRIRELLDRLRAVSADHDVVEAILCLNPTVEGDATGAYIVREITGAGLPNVNVTRIASGLPVGGDLEYADEVTLGRALAGRRGV